MLQGYPDIVTVSLCSKSQNKVVITGNPLVLGVWYLLTLRRGGDSWILECDT